VFNDPRMTSRGRMIAGLVALLVACALPKRVERGHHPGASKNAVCTSYEVQPLVIYGLESALSTRIAFHYEAGDDC
jgi:hypothetical protein